MILAPHQKAIADIRTRRGAHDCTLSPPIVADLVWVATAAQFFCQRRLANMDAGPVQTYLLKRALPRSLATRCSGASVWGRGRRSGAASALLTWSVVCLKVSRKGVASRSSHSRNPQRLARAISWNEHCGCAYIPQLLPESCFKDILSEYYSLRASLSDEGPCVARGRRIIALSQGTAWQLFRAHWLRLRLQTKAMLPFYPFASPCPMEYREYRQGSSMLWHKDTILTEPPQLELVYTLENTSDSVTRWAASHLDVLKENVHEVWTAPNSALLLQVMRETAKHCLLCNLI